MLNRTMRLSVVLLSSSLLFIMPTNAKIPFVANNIKEEFKVNEMVQIDNLGLVKNPIQIQYEKDKLESDKIKTEKLKQEQLEKEKINELQWQEFVLTYYGVLESECGKTDGITASNKRISRGMVASPPHIPFGTKIIIDGNEYVVEDRGSSKYIKVNNYGSIRLDVYTPRRESESDSQYKKRIQSYGVDRKVGYIVK